jgi:hypothetical protein
VTWTVFVSVKKPTVARHLAPSLYEPLLLLGGEIGADAVRPSGDELVAR